MKLIYIMGAGHVGSTIIDIVLGTHPQIESLGELSKFHRSIQTPRANRRCACGEQVDQCPFWLEVRARWCEAVGDEDVTAYLKLQNRFETSALGWFRLLWNTFRPSPAFRTFLRKTEALYVAIEEVGGKSHMVDSSLTPRRAYILSMIPSLNLNLIHLVRDGRGVIWSLMKPGKQTLTKKYVPAPAERTASYWVSANLQSMWVFGRLPKSRRRLLRYEDFVTNSAGTLTTIGRMVGLDLSQLVIGSDVVNSTQIRHTVGGNRVRMLKEIHIRADFAWQDMLPARERKIFWLMAGWLARRFGYVPA